MTLRESLMDLAIGTRLDRYEIVGTLGAGGMGEVYRAFDTQIRREVAVKILPESFAADENRLLRFQQEARTVLRKVETPEHVNTTAGFLLRGHPFLLRRVQAARSNPNPRGVFNQLQFVPQLRPDIAAGTWNKNLMKR